MKKHTLRIGKRLFVFTLSLMVFGSAYIASAQNIRWIRVGQLQSFFVDYGSENELTPINQNSFSWPAQYGDNQHTSRMKGLWIGATNFYDPVEKKVKSVKVVGSGPRYDATNQPLMIFPQSIKLIGKTAPPSVIVDYQNGAANSLYDVLDEIDPNLPCDRMIIIKFNTSMGVSVTKKVLAFTQQNHDNYIIYDYVFKNTGIYNQAGDTTDQTLNNFTAHFNYRCAFAGVTNAGWEPSPTWGAFSSTWGASTVTHDFGLFRPVAVSIPGFYTYFRIPVPDSIRGFYAYYGPNNERTGISYDQDWGCPKQNDGGPGLDGLLGSAKYAGYVTLFASQSPQNYSTDDPLQPTTTSYFGPDETICQSTVSQYNDAFMAARWSRMTEGHLPQSMEEQVGIQYAQIWNNANPARPGGAQGQSYGPYTLAPGDSIHIVFAEGVGGLSWEACRSIGATWYQYYTGAGTPPLTMPDGTVGTSYTDYARGWVQTGKDSLIKTFTNAITNYRSGYNIPKEPPAPNQFEVESGGDRIHLTWADNADSSPHFDGYVIYRSEGNIKDYRTIYNKVFECNASNVVHSYYDTTAIIGFQYYYYIQSKDDGTQNDIYPGTPLYSSMFLTMTIVPAMLNRIHEGVLRSHQSGNWDSTSTWERFDGSVWVNPAPYIPTYSDSTIIIYQGDTVTVTSADTVDQLSIMSGGVLIVNGGAALYIKNSDSTDLSLSDGTIKNYGSITVADSSEFLVAENSTVENYGTISSGISSIIEFEFSRYLHRQNGGSIPRATWAGSICEVTDVTDTAPSNIDQTFYHFIWNCPNQSANLYINRQNQGLVTLEILNTNWDHASTANPSNQIYLNRGAGYSYIGHIKVDGYNAALTLQSSGSIDTVYGFDAAISQGGMLKLSNTGDSCLYVCRGSIVISDSGYIGVSDLNNRTTINFYATSGNLTIPPAGRYDFGGTNFIVSSSSLKIDSITYPGSGNVTVESGSTVNLCSSVFSGSGYFSVDTTATIETSHPGGLNGNVQVTGLKTFKNRTSYNFTGTVPQVTGTLLPDTVINFTVNNGSGLTLSKSVVANGEMGLLNGLFAVGDNSVIVNGLLRLSNGNISVGSIPLLYGGTGSLVYSGSLAQTTSDAEFPASAGPYNLTINNSHGVTLHTSRGLNGSLSLTGKLNLMNMDTLTALTATSADTNSYVAIDSLGLFRLTSVGTSAKLFPIGTIDSYAPVWIANPTPGVADIISVRVMNDPGKAVGGGRVKAKWQISEGTPGGGNYTIRLGWMRKLEDSVFYSSTTNAWRIFRLSDTTQIFTADYIKPTIPGGRAIQHANITALDVFTVGTFTSLTDIEELQNNIPVEFSLKQNYPNPFNPSTTISFDIPTKSFVTLKIYDLIGREIAILASEELSAGSYTRIWNAGRFASGIYFYRLQAGSFINTKKLLLLK
jgi:hypothetical protein